MHQPNIGQRDFPVLLCLMCKSLAHSIHFFLGHSPEVKRQKQELGVINFS
jgi:hypothetical protein